LKPDYICPYCHAAIGLDDVNVTTDVALCRACGKTSSFALIAGSSAITPDQIEHVPKYVMVEKNPLRGTTITYRKISAILLFLIPFTAFWSGMSMWGIYGKQIARGQFDLGQSLFGLPFLIGTVILVSVILFLLLGKWQVRLHRGNGEVFVGIGPLGWTRRFSYSRDTQIALRNSSMRSNNTPLQAIVVQNGNEEFMFGAPLTMETKQYIAATLMQETQSAPLGSPSTLNSGFI
jgi:hypothetical protein